MYLSMKNNSEENTEKKKQETTSIFRLYIRLCKTTGNHIIKNKTQRNEDNSSVFVWRRKCCLLLTLNWKSQSDGEKRANSAIFVQAISYTYMGSLSQEEKREIEAVCLVVFPTVTQREEQTKRQSNEEIAAIVCRGRRLLCRAWRTNSQSETE